MIGNWQSESRLRRLRRAARTALKWLWIRGLYHSGLIRFAKWTLARKRAVIVLTFHRVLTDGEWDCTNSQSGILIRQRTFVRLIDHLVRYFEIVDLRSGAPDRNINSPRLRCAITFDDGWLDTYTNAFPALQKASRPATVFICPALLGVQHPFWPEQVVAFWRMAESAQPGEACRVLQAASPSVPAFHSVDALIEFLKKLNAVDRRLILAAVRQYVTRANDADPNDATMNWDQVNEMVAAGVSFGSHTLSHQILPNVPVTLAARELLQSREAIERHTNVSCASLAYPNGDHSAEVCDLAAEAGYQLAFTTRPGPWLPASNPLAIPRMNISEAKVCGPSGRFSRAVFEWAVIWNAFRHTPKKGSQLHTPKELAAGKTIAQHESAHAPR